MKNIKNISQVYEFMFELYKETALLFEEIEEQLKEEGIKAIGNKGVTEPGGRSLNKPTFWLLWAPERFFKKGKNVNTLIDVKCEFYSPSKEFEKPNVKIGIFKFSEPEDKIDKMEWFGSLDQDDLNENYEIVGEKEGIFRVKVNEWNGCKLKYFRFFEVPLEDLKNSAAVKKKICEPIFKILKK